MNEVKDDLGKQNTAKPTQLAETRIIEQLDAMIESLKTRRTSRSSTRSRRGGGGGAAAARKLPTEAELRLLKRMQQAVNKNTTDADALPKPQQDKQSPRQPRHPPG